MWMGVCMCYVIDDIKVKLHIIDTYGCMEHILNTFC